MFGRLFEKGYEAEKRTYDELSQNHTDYIRLDDPKLAYIRETFGLDGFEREKQVRKHFH